MDHLTAVPLLSDYFKEQDLKDVVVVSRMQEGLPVRGYGSETGCPVAFIDKGTLSPMCSDAYSRTSFRQERYLVERHDRTGGSIVEAICARKVRLA